MERIQLSTPERRRLEQWADPHGSPERLALRARIVLALADGLSDREVARLLGTARQTVALWRQRVLAAGSIATITMDAPGRGRKPRVPSVQREAVRKAWLEGQGQGRPRSVRDLARQFGLSAATVHRAIRETDRRVPRAPGPGAELGAAG